MHDVVKLVVSPATPYMQLENRFCIIIWVSGALSRDGGNRNMSLKSIEFSDGGFHLRLVKEWNGFAGSGM